MHIVFLAQDIEGKSGWSRYARDMTYALSRRGHRITVLVEKVTNDASWCQQIVCLQPPLHYLSMSVCALQYLRLRIILAQLSPDITHIIAEPYALLMGLMPKRHRWTLTIHGSYAIIPFRAGQWSLWATMRAWKRVQKIIAVSTFTKNYVKESEAEIFKQLELDKKITVITNAIEIKPQVAKHVPGGMYHILGVGAVKPRKGYLEAIRALAILRKKISHPFRYDIIGSLNDTAYVERLRHECGILNLTEAVRFLGPVSEEKLIEAYQNADAFLLLSTFNPPYVEGFVLAFMEAAAAGVPSVGPLTGGCPEAIANARSGYLCHPDDSESVASCLVKILEEKVIHPRECRTWAEQHNINDAAKKIEQLYLDATHF